MPPGGAQLQGAVASLAPFCTAFSPAQPPLPSPDDLQVFTCLCVPCARRVADTYPHQMLDNTARMYLYRWRPVDWCRAHPTLPSYTLHALQVGAGRGKWASGGWGSLGLEAAGQARVCTPAAVLRRLRCNACAAPTTPLQCGYKKGQDRLYLRLPQVGWSG